MTYRRTIGPLFLALLLPATPVTAQSLSLALRGGGGLPLGAFGETGGDASGEMLRSGAKNGFGYGLDASLSFGSRIGFYAGFDRVKFDCAEGTCGSSGDYTLSGVSAGVRLAPFAARHFVPWLKAGVTFNDLKASYGSGSGSLEVTSDRAPGYEVGAGADVPLFSFVAFSPQLRYVGQNLDYRVPGVSSPDPTEQGVKYLRFDLGLSYFNPARMRR